MLALDDSIPVVPESSIGSRALPLIIFVLYAYDYVRHLMPKRVLFNISGETYLTTRFSTGEVLMEFRDP